jgi:hypothetical protein
MQEGFTRGLVLRLLKMGHPIEGYCESCDEVWPIEVHERMLLAAKAVAAMGHDGHDGSGQTMTTTACKKWHQLTLEQKVEWLKAVLERSTATNTPQLMALSQHLTELERRLKALEDLESTIA